MDLDLKPIRVFLEVAQQRSFAGAAQVLRMTPASVTRIVAKLEADLGQQLLLRTTRQVSLTSAGARALAQYAPLVGEFDRVTQDFISDVAPDRGRLRLNAPQSLGVRVLPDLLAKFRSVYPDIAVEAVMTDALIDVIEDNCDLAIRISTPPTDKSTIWRKICEVSRLAIAAPSLFESHPNPKRPSDLDPAMCLSYDPAGQPETWEFHKDGQVQSVRAGQHFVSNNGEVLFGMAAAGHGITVLPRFIVADGLRSGAVAPVLPDWHTSSLWLTLFYPPYPRLPPLVATFSTFFEDYMRRTDGMEF